MLSGLCRLPGTSRWWLQDDTCTTERARSRDGLKVTCGARKLRTLHTYQGGGRVFLGGGSQRRAWRSWGRQLPQAANGPDGENPIEQVEQVASRTGSRAFVRTLQYSTRERYLSTFGGIQCRQMSRSYDITERRFWLANVVHRCFSVVKSRVFHLASLCSRINLRRQT